MNTFKSDCVYLDLKQSDGIFYQKQVSRSALESSESSSLSARVAKVAFSFYGYPCVTLVDEILFMGQA